MDTNGARAATPLLEVRGVTRRFGALAAVDRVSFALWPGEILGCIGPNGAGKTTLINLIDGLLQPHEGDICFAGQSIRRLAPHQRSRLGIARTFQVVKPLIGMTVRENVLVGALFGTHGHTRSQREAGLLADEALELVGLAPKQAWPVERLTLADRKALELARALAMGPRLLLLDEVMAGLNPAEIARKLDLLRRLNERGVTMLVIEHVMQVVMTLSHRVVVLHHGQKIADGPPRVVAADENVIRAYLGARYVALGTSRQAAMLGEDDAAAG
ncbi:MAG: ABC transporter ATP-binding protein [Chloroflexi bacterium]|nr:ABC transporter ATP-binding protein [Chloroflexota bacterium]